MKITTTSQIKGSTVVDTIGVVRGNTIWVRHLGRDIMAGAAEILAYGTALVIE